MECSQWFTVNSNSTEYAQATQASMFQAAGKGSGDFHSKCL